jgi:ribosome-associated protein
MATTETRRMVLAAAEACEDKKAEDTRILELDAVDAGFTDFFLITSGSNERQTQAIADEVELRLKKDFQTYPNSVEGRRQGEWILMDYVDFVVHIFLTEKRAYYDIERLRKSAQTVDQKELKTMLVKRTAVARAKPAKKTAAKKTTVKKAVKKAVARRKPAISKAEEH